MASAWCPGCQRGNKYDKNGACQDCGLELATPYKYEDMDGKEDQVMDESYVKGEGIEVLVDIPKENIVVSTSVNSLLPKKKMSEATKAKMRATRAKNKSKKGSENT